MIVDKKDISVYAEEYGEKIWGLVKGTGESHMFIAAFNDLADVMEHIPGWFLNVTDDQDQMPLWIFGSGEDQPFSTVLMLPGMPASYVVWVDGIVDRCYSTLFAEDVEPLVYAFRLFV